MKINEKPEKGGKIEFIIANQITQANIKALEIKSGFKTKAFKLDIEIIY